MLMHIVWDLHPLKPPSSHATRSHPGKAKSYEPNALNKTMLPMRRKKSITISHTQHREKRRPTLGARKSRQMKKTGGKLKENKINKLK